MKSLLITGGAGFIGANFVRYWRSRHPGDRLIVLDSLTYAGNRSSLDGVAHIEFIHADIRDGSLVEKIMRELSVSAIVHFAAETHVDRSILGPDAFIETNIVGTHELLKAAKRIWLDGREQSEHRFHHVSTDEVYGTLGAADPRFTETTRYAPNSPYAASKAASDHLVRAYHHTYGLDATISHCSNNYGPFQFPEKLIPLFVTRAFEGLPLPIYGDGRHVRDWLDVDDHCRGIELILQKGLAGQSYNIGGGAELANIAVVDALCSAVDRAFAKDPSLKARFPLAAASRGLATASFIRHVPDRAGHDRRYAIDAGKIRAELDYTPRHDFGASLERTVQWYIDNELWWRSISDGKRDERG